MVPLASNKRCEAAHHIATKIVNTCVIGARGVAFPVTAARWNR